MNTEQRRCFYFPAWHSCAAALGWVESKGRLVADLDAQRSLPWPSPAREELVGVVDLARSLAAAEHRAVRAKDLRHACNHVASRGKTVHSEAMDNRATSMAVRLFRLLEAPVDLNAVMDWLNPEEADRRGYVRWVKKLAPEATLVAISTNAWGTSDWESKPMAELRWLARTACRGIERRRQATRAVVEHGVDAENIPF